jgi:hypothetical protein
MSRKLFYTIPPSVLNYGRFGFFSFCYVYVGHIDLEKPKRLIKWKKIEAEGVVALAALQFVANAAVALSESE